MMELSLSAIHECLINDPSKLFVQTIDGQLVDMFEWATGNLTEEVHLYSGSFNPLHEGHKAIFNAMQLMDASSMKMFELSINRFDKPPVTVEQLGVRLAQFVGYAPVLITNHSLFEDKAAALNSICMPTFHVGADTLIRILLSYPSNKMIETLGCRFVFYDRIMNDNKVVIPTDLPVNFTKGSEIPDHLLRFSSTAIRNAANITT